MEFRPILATGEYYHIFNRGVEKRIVYSTKRDYQRFIETIIYYQDDIHPQMRFSYQHRPTLKPFAQHTKTSPVDLIAYVLMPTHFHLLLKQTTDNGISLFISKLTNSYTKYYNTKHKRVGPLFQGSFKAVRVEDDNQLIHLSRYIHLNPVIDYLAKDLRSYLHSSYPEYVGMTQHAYCQKEEVLSHFSKKDPYEQFVLSQEDYGRELKMIERLLLDAE